MLCKKTLIVQPTELETITEGVDYPVTDLDDAGVWISNNQDDRHYFSEEDKAIYFY